MYARAEQRMLRLLLVAGTMGPLIGLVLEFSACGADMDDDDDAADDTDDEDDG